MSYQEEQSIINKIKQSTGATGVTNNGDGTYSWTKKNWRGTVEASGTYDYAGQQNASQQAKQAITNYNNKIKNYIGTAESNLNGMLNIGQEAYNNSKNLFSKTDDLTSQAISNFNTFNQYASDAYNIANQMTPGINNIDNQGDNMLNIADQLFNLQEGDTLAGQYVSALKAIDPNRYVSMAASDVQNSYSNAQGQMQRTMSRQGMSASGQAANLQKNWGIAMASALAGAKTKARQQGISERLQAMSSAMEMASGMQKQGTEEKLSAVEARGKQIDALTNAGRMTQAAAEGLLSAVDSYNKTYQTNLDASRLLMEAQQKAAEYYSQQAGGLINLGTYLLERYK